MYAITPLRSPRLAKLAPPLDDADLVHFCELVETTRPEQWEVRTRALQQLVGTVPPGLHLAVSSPSSPPATPSVWYESPKHLRHLGGPLAELVKDPRSSVVKRTCESLTVLFQACRASARYLFKDLMPCVVRVHAQTVHVIRTYVMNMMTDSIPVVPCKAAMPLWLEKVKNDKSRTVREACATYLLLALQSWDNTTTHNNNNNNNNETNHPNYLTFDIWHQVGTVLVRALRDPYPSVRNVAKTAVNYIRVQQPQVWDDILQDPNGPAVKDAKLQKWLWRLGDDQDDTDLSSVGSRSVASTRSASRSRSSQSTPHRGVPSNVLVGDIIGHTAASTRTSLRRTHPVGLGPAVRTTAVPQETSSSPRYGRPGRHYSSPLSKRANITSNANSPPQRNKLTSYAYTGSAATTTASPSRQPRTSMSSSSIATRPEDEGESPGPNTNNLPTTTTTTLSFDDAPFLQSMEELKKHAKTRKSRRSLSLQERFRLSGLSATSSLLMEDDNDKNKEDATPSSKDPQGPNDDTAIAPNGTDTTADSSPTLEAESAASSPLPVTTVISTPTAEHVQIAQELLVAHRAHVDQIMDTLRLEMDALRDMEVLLLQENRATEGDVLEYFESVGLCLDQRTSRGKELQREMDRIANHGSRS